jgi:integrase
MFRKAPLITTAITSGLCSARLERPSPARKGSTVAESTVNTELKCIKRFFNRAVELGFLRDSPARRVELLKTPKKQPRFFDEAEMRLILDDCDVEWVRDIHLGLLLTGMRIGELVNIEWDDIDLVARKLIVKGKTFWKPKGYEERSIALHGAFYDLLCGMERKTNWVFTKADGKKVNIHSLEARFRN